VSDVLFYCYCFISRPFKLALSTRLSSLKDCVPTPVYTVCTYALCVYIFVPFVLNLYFRFVAMVVFVCHFS